MLKPLTVCIATNCGKFLKKWEYRTSLPASCKPCMQAKKQQLEPDMEKWSYIKLRKEYVEGICCHPAYLTYLQSTSWEMLGWTKHKLKSRLLGGISITSHADNTMLMAEREENPKSLLMKVKEESKKVGLKLNIQKMKIMASGLITSWEIDRETGNSVRLYFGGLQNHCRWWLQLWN